MASPGPPSYCDKSGFWASTDAIGYPPLVRRSVYNRYQTVALMTFEASLPFLSIGASFEQAWNGPELNRAFRHMHLHDSFIVYSHTPTPVPSDRFLLTPHRIFRSYFIFRKVTRMADTTVTIIANTKQGIRSSSRPAPPPPFTGLGVARELFNARRNRSCFRRLVRINPAAIFRTISSICLSIIPLFDAIFVSTSSHRCSISCIT